MYVRVCVCVCVCVCGTTFRRRCAYVCVVHRVRTGPENPGKPLKNFEALEIPGNPGKALEYFL